MYTSNTQCTGEENTGEFLKSIGVGMVMRNAAWAFGYGVNKAKLNITHTDPEFEWETIGMKTFTNNVTIDGTEQTVVSGQGDESKVKFTWIDDGKTMRREIVEGKFPGIVIKMYFDDDGVMITETFFKGITSKRFFTKQSKK